MTTRGLARKLNLTRNILCIFHVRCLGLGSYGPRSMALGVLAENAIHVFLCTQELRVKFMTRCEAQAFPPLRHPNRGVRVDCGQPQ